MIKTCIPCPFRWRNHQHERAAITITIMAMAAANTMGIQISLPAAILLSAVLALGACGASGVAGGSPPLIPMACSLFASSNDIAMQVVGVGFIIRVIQDSVETCLNSASHVEFAATAEIMLGCKQGRQLPAFMYSKKERQQLGIEACISPDFGFSASEY